MVVEVGDDIQAAIDSLPPPGGCVCLKTGVHGISRPLRIAQSNVVLKGEYHDSVPVERPGFLARTARSLLIKVAPLPQMELEARTPDFRYP